MKTMKHKVHAGYGRVLVEPHESLEGESEGGILISQHVNALDVGTVVSVGHPDEKFGLLEDHEMPFKVGDRVLYAPTTAQTTSGGKTQLKPLTRDVNINGGILVSVLQVEVVAIVP